MAVILGRTSGFRQKQCVRSSVSVQARVSNAVSSMSLSVTLNFTEPFKGLPGL